MTVEEWKRKNLPIQRKPITNADRIRAMSDEELANFFQWCVECEDCPVKCEEDAICYNRALEWLKKEIKK